MCAYVLLNELRQTVKMRGLPSILAIFAKSLVDSITQMREFMILFIK